MRRTLILVPVLVVAVACAKKEQAAPADTMAVTTPSTVSLADFAGTWEGRVTAQGKDSVEVTTVLTATADTTGWSQTIVNAQDPSMTRTIPGRVTSVAGDSIIVEYGPFASVRRPGQQVTTHAIYRLQNGTLVGTIHATYADGKVDTLRSEATRK